MSKVFDLIRKEEERQARTVELIASENFVSADVLRAMGSVLTNKYAEGYPGHRYYGGCGCVDEVEDYCREAWKEVYHTDYHVNVQPHCGTQANMAAFQAVLQPEDTILALDLNCGGHLSHGSRVSFSGKLYHCFTYGVDKDGYIDMQEVYDKAVYYRPRILLTGASAYSRFIDYERFAEIARESGSLLMVDMAHVAGLIAGGVHPSPFGYADIITTTTHKTLRGPRGGLIFCKPELAKKVDGAVFPGVQGGPLEHIIAAKAVCAEEALEPSFREYAAQVVKNAKYMAEQFKCMGYDVVTGGTDNHMFLLDFSRTHPNITGAMVQEACDKRNITLNKNMVPGDKRKPNETSGVRIGTAAMTTAGFQQVNFALVAHDIDEIIWSL